MIKGSWADVIENKYNTEQKCEKLFLSHLWPDGIKCPKCGCFNPITNKIHANKQKTFVEFKCAKCHKKITEKIDCIFTRSQLSFRDWLKAVYRIAIKQKSTSSVQMEDELGIYQQAAWQLFIRISQLAKQDVVLDGKVEMDEWYSNGNPAYKHNYQQSMYGSDKGKIGESIPIFGMISRPVYYIDENGKKQIQENSKIVIQMLELRGQRSVATKDIEELINKFISKSASVTFYTDDAKLYKTKDLFGGRDHKVIPHNVNSNPELQHHEKFAKGDIYTNNIEGAFGQISDYFVGTHNKITRKHVQKYLDMFCFRWNNRHLTTEEKIHEYLSKLPSVTHKNIDEFIGDKPTGRISKVLRFYINFHSELVSDLNDIPIEKVTYRNEFIKMTKDINTDLLGPDSENTPEKPYIHQAMKQVLSEFIDTAKYLDTPEQEQFYKNVEKELSELFLISEYSEKDNDLENRLAVGDIIYTDKNVPGEPEQFKQRMTARKQRENAKKRRQEKKKSEKNSKKSLSSNKK